MSVHVNWNRWLMAIGALLICADVALLATGRRLKAVDPDTTAIAIVKAATLR